MAATRNKGANDFMVLGLFGRAKTPLFYNATLVLPAITTTSP
jgi:hypothetical protein